MGRATVSLVFLMSVVPAGAVLAQGRTEYFNVESPQVKPIAVARLDGHDYILVCNTPDNSLEIWDTNEGLPIASRFKKRIRVGLEPVTVAWNPQKARAYTANFLGDSITMIALSAPGGNISAVTVMTRDVGDEPMDIAFSANGNEVFVTHNTTSTFGRRDALTLEPVSVGSDHVDLLDSGTNPPRAIKEPRSVRVSGNQLFVLGFKGGNNPAVYDFDVYARDLTSGAVNTVSGLGSTNFNMAFAGNGELWVVGGEAQNAVPGVDTEPEVAALLTGFVKSTIYRVTGAGGGAPVVTRRDLNDLDGTESPAPKASAFAQPTDVVLYEPAGGTKKVIFTAFGSDVVGLLSPSPFTGAYSWPLTRLPMKMAPNSTNPAVGPRGLVIKYSNTAADSTDPGDRLYVMNRLDNSVSIVNPAAETWIATFALKNDPTPDYVRAGRVFLYGADFSGSGFVSCASCHMDGRTDSLVWKLGTPLDPAPPFPLGFADGLDDPATFSVNKGEMVTQSLQGLINFEVEPSIQGFVTNAPYHWRGDRADFIAFNGAFVGLLGGGGPLRTDEMEAFRTFINSIHYPPNLNQPDDRTFTGTLGDPDNPVDGGDAKRGLKLFHIFPLDLCAQRACVQCHFLSDGSNNKATVPGNDIIETAQMRGLYQREARLDKVAGAPSNVVTAEFGLTHDGVRTSLNQFINRFTAEFLGLSDGLLAVKQFAREFDFCVAPLAGRSYTVHKDNNESGEAGFPETTAMLDLMESQAALANVGVAVHVRVSGQESGYFLDLTQDPAEYRLEGSNPAVTLDRGAILALAVQLRDRLVFTATPLGSERRVASTSGTSATIPGAPSAVILLPARTNTAYADVPSLVKNWDPAHPVAGMEFDFDEGPQGTRPEPNSLKSIRFLQYGLVVDGNGQYGLTGLRHEAPRRFVVAGTGIQPGAVLRLFVPNTSTPPVPFVTPLSQVTTIEFALPLHPTAEKLPNDGRRVWQTAVEVDPMVLYTLMLGGPKAKGVPEALDPVGILNLTEPPSPNSFDPDGSNWHYVIVRNPDGSEYDGGWQQLKLQP